METYFGYIGALIIGMVLGLTGGGGSILTVPLLVYILGYNPIVATAYSLFVVGSSSVVGIVQKYQRQMVDFKTGFTFVFPSFLAVYLTRRFLVHSIPDTLFSTASFTLTKDTAIMAFFAIVMFWASFSMIKKRPSKTVNAPQPYYKTFVQGLGIGFVTGLIGAGGGFLYVPALVLWAGLPMKKAVGTSLVIIAVNSLIGFVGDVQTSTIDWPFLLSFSAITVVGILLGGYLSKFISNRKLKRSFGYFVLVMAVFILLREFAL